MAELVHLKGNSYYIRCPTNIGIYADENSAVLIDSGNDKERAKKVLSIINKKGWKLRMIINTHSNADHIGGNAYLQKETGCRIASTSLEKTFIENPFLEPSLIYGGFPPYPLLNKFLLAKSSKVTDIIEDNGRILDTKLEAIPLPGHYLQMIGIRTADDVVFLADSLFSTEIIEKHPMIFMYDVQGFLDTLDMVAGIKASVFLLSHGGSADDIRGLVESNKKSILSVISRIKETSSSWISDQDILAKMLPASNETEYALNLSTLRSYLSYLINKGMKHRIERGRLLWRWEGCPEENS